MVLLISRVKLYTCIQQNEGHIIQIKVNKTEVFTLQETTTKLSHPSQQRLLVFCSTFTVHIQIVRP